VAEGHRERAGQPGAGAGIEGRRAGYSLHRISSGRCCRWETGRGLVRGTPWAGAAFCWRRAARRQEGLAGPRHGPGRCARAAGEKRRQRRAAARRRERAGRTRAHDGGQERDNHRVGRGLPADPPRGLWRRPAWHRKIQGRRIFRGVIEGGILGTRGQGRESGVFFGAISGVQNFDQKKRGPPGGGPPQFFRGGRSF